jgi:hypothetical protein
MAFSKRVVVMSLVMALMVALETLPVAAQDNTSTKKSSRADEQPSMKGTRVRRLPSYFGQIGLSPDQRESVYKTIAKHQEKIEALEKQLTEARSSMMRDCEAVLTLSQKELLEQRRAARKASRNRDQSAAPVKKVAAP